MNNAETTPPFFAEMPVLVHNIRYSFPRLKSLNEQLSLKKSKVSAFQNSSVPQFPCPSFLFLVLFLFLHAPAKATPQSSVLLVRNAEALTILDTYEQPLSATDKSSIRKGAPFRIISKEIFLGDGLSRASRVVFNSTEYFIQKNESGSYLTKQPDSYSILTGCEFISDTFRVVDEKSVLIYTQFDMRGTRFWLQKDQDIVRVFIYKNKYYSKTLSDIPRYGWIMPSSASHLKEYSSAISSPQKQGQLSPAIEKKIRTFIDNKNRQYRSIFRFLNAETTKEIPPPNWEVTMEDGIVRGTLFMPERTQGHFRESTRLLREEIEKMLIGSKYYVARTKTGFIIRVE